tara:strand:- start:305 stop:448 length:144 start_codon:yes stop_codon:yes gene_type:complete
MVMLGMMLEAYSKETIPAHAWFIYALSPFFCPIFIGMYISEKTKDNE